MRFLRGFGRVGPIGLLACGVVVSSGVVAAQPSVIAPAPPSAQKVAQSNAGPPAEVPADSVPTGDAATTTAPVTPSGDAGPVAQSNPYAGRPQTSFGSSPIEKLIASQPDWACQYDAHAMTERHVIVACKEGSVLTLARTPTGVQLLGRRETNGRVEAFYEQDGSVWMRVLEERAERVVPGAILSTDRTVQTPATATPTAPEPKAEATPAAVGKVKVVNGREVVVELAVGHGIDEGQRMSMVRPATGADSFFVEEPVVAKVVKVMKDQVLLRIGMNETVEPGFIAKVTQDRETGSRRVPPRVYGVWDLRTVLRPILNIGNVGGGVSGELGLARRTEYFRFGVNLSPISYVGATDEGSVFSAGGYVFGAVDHNIYSAGIGVGANTVNDTDGESESGSGLSIVQLLRIGAVDGLHFESRVEAVIFRSEVLFSYLQLQGQIAVADTAWLIVRGGGGSLGYGFGEVVVRNLLWGTGQAGSTFLELGLGGAGLFEQACVGAGCEPVVSAGTDIGTDRDVGGPMFTAGLEWRL
jgi:hypothetical protein